MPPISSSIVGLSFRRPRVIAAALLAITTSMAPPARADAESDAKDLFARARELRLHGDCRTAAPLFRKAYAIHPKGLGSLRNLAECEEQVGNFASARRAWLDVKRALVAVAPDPKYDGWDTDAQQAADRLKSKVATFIVDVIVSSPEVEAPAHESSGVEVFVNGESVGTKLVNTPLERDPGTYRIRAQMPDAAPVEQIVQLTAGDNPRVTIRLVRTPRVDMRAGVVAVRDDARPAEEPKRGRGLRTVGWVAVGVGAGALVSAGVTALLRASAMSDLDATCPTHQNCAPSLRDTADRGTLMSTLTTVLLPLGVLATGTGITLLVFDAKKASTTSSLTVTPSVGGASAAWRFQ